MTAPQLIGKPVPRVDALGKVAGAALFGDDLAFPNLLHGKVLRSPHAHARILRVDTSRARRVPGVKAVVTGRDFVALGGEALRDQPFLAVDKVRHVGEAVAAVAAVDDATAEAACQLIEVEYEALPLVLDVEQALEPEAPLLHEAMASYHHLPIIQPQPGTNICHRLTFLKGDVEEGWRQSDHLFEHSFTTQMVQHSAIEPHVAVAQVDPMGRIVVWVPNDSPHRLRNDLADALELPLDRLRVIVPPYMGGGFGGKGGIKIEAVCIALAHFTGGRPVKINLTREEVFTSSLVRHPSVVRLKTGVKRDGTLVARQATAVYDTGAYAEKGPTVCQQACVAAVGPYRIPHVRVDGYTVYTNKPVAGAMRGYGIPQVAWAHESQMDIIAQELGLDPLELRLKNAVEEGDQSPTGQQRLYSVGLKECLERVAQELDWGRPRPPNRGVGIACAFKNTKTPTGSTAFVRLNHEGGATILTSTVEIGQGSNTAFCQIVAEELGVPLERITVVTPDTDVTPFDASTTSSRSTFHMGNAVRLAAGDARRQLLEMAATLMGVPVEALEYGDGRVSRRDGGGGGLTIQQLIAAHYGAGMDILGRGSFYALPPEQGKGMWSAPSVFWMYAAHGVEVEVDPETGKVRVLKAVGAHDVGKAINPMMVEQQIEDGIAKGIGYALLEEMLLDPQGQVLNPNWHTYLIPTAFDVTEIKPIIVEAAHEQGPYGAKGVGEMTMVPTAPAIGNAIAHATGLRILDLPITQEKLWRALQGVSKGTGAPSRQG